MLRSDRMPAWWALPAFCFTVEVSSAMLAAVPCNAALPSLVRVASNWLPEAMPLAALSALAMPTCTSRAILMRLLRMISRTNAGLA